MSEKGAALQTYNQELVKGIETLKKRRADLIQVILEEEKKKAMLEDEMARVKEKLSDVCHILNESLQKKEYYDEAIGNSEAAYMKILESSQALLNVVRQDAFALDQNVNSKREHTA